MREKTTDPFYLTDAWRELRADVLRQEPLCRDCMDLYRARVVHKVKAATCVHHIKHRTECPELSLVRSNLMPLCDAHHNARHPEKGRSKQAPKDAPRARVIKI